MNPPHPTRPLGPAWILAVGLLAGFAGAPACCAADAEPVRPGAVIYENLCAGCHGAAGQGTPDGYPQPLYGDRSLEGLTRYIERNMPEGDAEACVGEDAREVAAYIYGEFYSLEARQRKGLAPIPRVELLRLTVPQFRNAVADIVGAFAPEPDRRERRGRRRRREERTPPREPQPGLLAEYYQSRGMNKADRLQEQQVDRRIDFDFQTYSPDEGISADQFAIIWQGSLKTDDTGFYEFRIRTENGARMYLNNDPMESRGKLRDDSSVKGQSALIDGWVSSGEMRELTTRVFLLGGRQYPLRVEFFKYKEETASIRLEWKPPHGAWTVLDHRHLTTAPSPRVFVIDTPFPADDRSLGYERGSSVSHEWLAAVSQAAVATANEVVDRLPLLADLDDEDSPERQEQVAEFLIRFASQAYRRPLTREEEEFFRQCCSAGASDLETAVRRAVLLVLHSPQFLYTDLTPPEEAPGPHAIAARLAWSLWDSVPDEALWGAADRGELATAEQVEAQARRMLADPRAREKMRRFFHDWLEMDERDPAKDPEAFPEFDEQIIADLRYSLELFLDRVLWSDDSDYRQLLLADYLVLNERLCEMYGPAETAQEDNGGEDQGETASAFRPVSFPAGRRAGVLTHPYLLSAFAYPNTTSPIHRGVFLTRNIVGRSLKPPPVAVAFKDEEFAPDLTMREKITQLTQDRACMTCHSVINPLGFALENYDALGRWRTTDNDKPIDTTSKYVTLEGDTLDVQSAQDIAHFAAESEMAHRAFVTQLFHHLIEQDPAAYGRDVVARLSRQFADDHFNMQNLMVRIAVLTAMHGHPLPTRTGSES